MCDCHGTADTYPTLRTSARSSPTGTDLTLLRNPDGTSASNGARESCINTPW